MTSLASKRWAGLRRLPLSKVLISRLIRREAQTPGARLFRPGTGQGFIGTSAASCPRQGADSKLGSHCFLGPTWQSALGYWGRGKRKCALSRAGREPRLTSLPGLWTPGAHGAPAGSCSPGKEGVREGSRQTPELGGAFGSWNWLQRSGVLSEPDLEGSRSPRASSGVGRKKGLFSASKLCVALLAAPSTAGAHPARPHFPPGPAATTLGVCGPGGVVARRGLSASSREGISSLSLLPAGPILARGDRAEKGPLQ